MLITVVLTFTVLLLFFLALSLKLLSGKKEAKPVCAMGDTTGGTTCGHCGADRREPVNCLNRGNT